MNAVADRDEERDGAGHPRQRAAAAPGGHEELAPQVDDHEEEEQLHAPEVEAVDEVADDERVPPRRPGERDHDAGDEDDDERRERQDAEDVDPRGDVRRLRVREELLGRQRRDGRLRARGRSRSAGRSERSSACFRSRGNGSDDRQGEDDDHRHDHDEVRDRDQEPARVQVVRPPVEVDHVRERERCGRRNRARSSPLSATGSSVKNS